LTLPTSKDDYFSENYRDYVKQNPPKKLDHYIEVIDHHSKIRNLDILDIGCGLGAFLERASQQRPDWSLSGTDMDASGVAATQRLVPEASVISSSASEQSHPAASFDVITAWDVIEHVDDLMRVRDAVAMMIRPEGFFHFVVPVYDGLMGPIITRLDTDPTHVHKTSRHFWLDWASERFQVVGWHGIFRFLPKRGPYIHYPTLALKGIAPAILVSCRFEESSTMRRS